MKDGHYVFYYIEWQVTHKSKWLKPNSPLKPVNDKEWRRVGRDSWGQSIDPWTKSWPSRLKNQKASNEMFDLRMSVEYDGWYTKKFAEQALKRLERDDKKGIYDYFDGYGKHCQQVRHRFRIVRVMMAKFTGVLETV